MAIAAPLTMVFEFPNAINESLQIGDRIYYCVTIPHGTFSTTDPNLPLTHIVHVGLCTSIVFNPVTELWEVHVLIEPGLTVNEQAAIQNTYNPSRFIMFNKDTETNRNSLLGYYAEVRLGNDSPNIAELFAVSTEVSESSK